MRQLLKTMAPAPVRLLRLLIPLPLLFLGACNPCFGLSACGEGSLNHLGWVIAYETEEPVEGVQVEFRRTGGVRIEPERILATTDSQGIFRLRASASRHGPVQGVLSFRSPPPYEAYPYEEAVDLVAAADHAVHFMGLWGVGPVPADSLRGAPALASAGHLPSRLSTRRRSLTLSAPPR